MTPMTYAPASWKARACGNIGATPRPPPTHSTFFAWPSGLGTPIGPTIA